ncbi:MAG TPA: hypothetical protein VFC51_07085 [Chloroflexota bacterium]|nr:hypothetical protein [Chloroflexota bacterium]
MKSLPLVLRTVSIVGAGLALCAAAVGIAGAQPGGPPGGDRPVPSDHPWGGPPGGDQPGPRAHMWGGPPDGAGMGELHDAFLSDLAANLGVSEDALTSALQKTHDDMRPMMEERFQAMRERMQDRMGGGGPRPRPGAGGAFGRMRGPAQGDGAGTGPGMGPREMLATVADVLNMDPDDLRQQLEGGATIAEIGQNQGIDPDALADQLASAFEDQFRSRIHDMIRRAIDRPIPGMGLGPR